MVIILNMFIDHGLPHRCTSHILYDMIQYHSILYREGERDHVHIHAVCTHLCERDKLQNWSITDGIPLMQPTRTRILSGLLGK